MEKEKLVDNSDKNPDYVQYELPEETMFMV